MASGNIWKSVACGTKGSGRKLGATGWVAIAGRGLCFCRGRVEGMLVRSRLQGRKKGGGTQLAISRGEVRVRATQKLKSLQWIEQPRKSL